MGLDVRSDPWTAYCFDEACYIWGTHVSNELARARNKAKNQKAAEKAQKMVLRKLLQDGPQYRKVGRSAAIDVEDVSEDEDRELPPVVTNRNNFRDPASVIRSGE